MDCFRLHLSGYILWSRILVCILSNDEITTKRAVGVVRGCYIASSNYATGVIAELESNGAFLSVFVP